MLTEVWDSLPVRPSSQSPHFQTRMLRLREEKWPVEGHEPFSGRVGVHPGFVLLPGQAPFYYTFLLLSNLFPPSVNARSIPRTKTTYSEAWLRISLNFSKLTFYLIFKITVKGKSKKYGIIKTNSFPSSSLESGKAGKPGNPPPFFHSGKCGREAKFHPG